MYMYREREDKKWEIIKRATLIFTYKMGPNLQSTISVEFGAHVLNKVYI